MVLGVHQPFCDVSPQGHDQQMGYAASDFLGCVYPLSDGACYHNLSGGCGCGCGSDYHWDCDACGYDHDHGYGYGQGCGSNDGNRGRGETGEMCVGNASGNVSERVILRSWGVDGAHRNREMRTDCGVFLWGIVSARDCGKGWI